MKRSTAILLFIVLVSLLELILIKPLVPSFFGMKMPAQVLYVIGLYGFPLLVLLPVLLLALPFACVNRQGRGFTERWFNLSKKGYFFISLIILFMNSMLVLSKYAFDTPLFTLVKYAEIQGADGDLKDLREGRFKSRFALIERSGKKQVETYFGDQRRVEYALEWLFPNEYRLISQGQPNGMNDTLDVKVVRNYPGYYECYLRFGEYAEQQRIEK